FALQPVVRAAVDWTEVPSTAACSFPNIGTGNRSTERWSGDPVRESRPLAVGACSARTAKAFEFLAA
ncbi:MAG TPA: hypothetical protein VHA77_11600, partial [Xanthobacteraceae bacterium]|nr:hypothetical protein [Xanthobacteraceae bacterium]